MHSRKILEIIKVENSQHIELQCTCISGLICGSYVICFVSLLFVISRILNCVLIYCLLQSMRGNLETNTKTSATHNRTTIW
jgi:hypothetical protein